MSDKDMELREAVELLRAFHRAAPDPSGVTPAHYRQAWRDVEKYLARFEQKPCDFGLFGDRQLDLADRKDMP